MSIVPGAAGAASVIETFSHTANQALQIVACDVSPNGHTTMTVTLGQYGATGSTDLPLLQRHQLAAGSSMSLRQLDAVFDGNTGLVPVLPAEQMGHFTIAHATGVLNAKQMGRHLADAPQRRLLE